MWESEISFQTCQALSSNVILVLYWITPAGGPRAGYNQVRLRRPARRAVLRWGTSSPPGAVRPAGDTRSWKRKKPVAAAL